MQKNSATMSGFNAIWPELAADTQLCYGTTGPLSRMGSNSTHQLIRELIIG
jgi:hypothetical protein